MSKYSEEIIQPPRLLTVGEQWDLTQGYFLQPGDPSSGTVRYLATGFEGECMMCGKQFLPGDVIDEDFVIGHAACFEQAEDEGPSEAEQAEHESQILIDEQKHYDGMAE